MDIYMAGAYNGNLSALWRNALDALSRGGDELEKYMASSNNRQWLIDDYIKDGLKNGVIPSRDIPLGKRYIYP